MQPRRPTRGPLTGVPPDATLAVPAALFSSRDRPSFPVFDARGRQLDFATLRARETGLAHVLADDVPHLDGYLDEHLHEIVSIDAIPPAHRAWAAHHAALHGYERLHATLAADARRLHGRDIDPVRREAADLVLPLAGAVTAVARLLADDTRTLPAFYRLAHEASGPEAEAVRTSALAVVLGLKSRRPGRSGLLEVALGGLFADLGLIGTAAEGLAYATPGEIRNEALERAQREHPRRSLSLMARMGLATAGAQDAVRWHHERWDGRGYPDGLPGEHTPDVARCVAITAAYSALIEPARGRDGLSPFMALEALTGDRGAYDPSLLRVFVRLIGDYIVAGDRLM